jgi:hypothetical protein
MNLSVRIGRVSELSESVSGRQPARKQLARFRNAVPQK